MARPVGSQKLNILPACCALGSQKLNSLFGFRTLGAQKPLFSVLLALWDHRWCVLCIVCVRVCGRGVLRPWIGETVHFI